MGRAAGKKVASVGKEAGKRTALAAKVVVHGSQAMSEEPEAGPSRRSTRRKKPVRPYYTEGEFEAEDSEDQYTPDK